MDSNIDTSQSYSEIENLNRLAQDHPYYALAHFHLLSHHKKNDSPLFNSVAAKTSLFFNNTNWLAWQLHLQANIEAATTLLNIENKIGQQIRTSNNEPQKTNIKCSVFSR